MRAVLRPFLNIVIVAGVTLALWPLGQTAYGLWNQRELAAQFQSQNQGRKASSTPARGPARTAELKLPELSVHQIGRPRATLRF
jgi:hypothetical protein